MPSKRQPSKQRRAAQNRAARSALAVRRENAARVAEEAAARPSSADEPVESTTPAAKARPLSAALRGHRDVPGGRAALLALLFAVGGVVTLFTIDDIPVNKAGEVLSSEDIDALEKKGESPLRDSFLEVYGPVAVALPLVAAGMGFWSVRVRRSRRYVIAALVVLVLASLPAGLLFVPSVIALTVASYQMRKAERLAAETDAPPSDDEPEPADPET